MPDGLVTVTSPTFGYSPTSSLTSLLRSLHCTTIVQFDLFRNVFVRFRPPCDVVKLAELVGSTAQIPSAVRQGWLPSAGFAGLYSSHVVGTMLSCRMWFLFNIYWYKINHVHFCHSSYKILLKKMHYVDKIAHDHDKVSGLCGRAIRPRCVTPTSRLKWSQWRPDREVERFQVQLFIDLFWAGVAVLLLVCVGEQFKWKGFWKRIREGQMCWCDLQRSSKVCWWESFNGNRWNVFIFRHIGEVWGIELRKQMSLV